MKDIASRMKLRWEMFLNSVYYLKYPKALLLNAWVTVKKGKIIKRNWGDDINQYLIELVSGKKVVFRNMSQLHRLFPMKNYICIGSILSAYETKQSIIWGAGFISEDQRLVVRPKEIKSVRGVLSRNILLSQGIECPEVYGDPALLVSYYYSPKNIKKIYKLGIITHIADRDNKIVSEFLKCHRDCICIDLGNYDKWTDVLDEVLACEKTISSSLHGLIISDSYGIPNRWVRFSDKVAGGDFKFLDYFSSVDRCETCPENIYTGEKLSELYINEFGNNTSKVDYRSILDSCPFEKVKR